MVLERGSQLDVVGQVPASISTGPGSGKNGGAHSAAGGVAQGQTIASASTPYGSIYDPKTNGSAGGNGGNGGATIYIKVTNKFVFDGNLNASGAGSAVGGGGSGGSIWVVVVNLEGFGNFIAEGGASQCSDCGGGSGGKIGVTADSSKFSGNYMAQGGWSPSTFGYGGPGSIYTTTGTGQDQLRKFIIDNANGQQHNYLTLNEDQLDIKFENIEIKNYAKFQMVDDKKQRKIVVDKIEGDGTGLISVRENQEGTLERVATGNNSISYLRVNLELASGGQFLMSESTVILGLFPIALKLDGVMRGVLNLEVGEGRKISIGKNAKIVPFFETAISRLANVTFGTFQLAPGSGCDFDADHGAVMIVNQFNVKFNSYIKGDFFRVNASNMDVEQGARFSCAGPDRQQSSSIDLLTGPGIGTTTNNNAWGGAGHGGVGGEQYNQRNTEGQAYDSLYQPSMPGSRSVVNGGRGGGVIHLNIGDKLVMDGLMTVDGDSSNNGGNELDVCFYLLLLFLVSPTQNQD